MALIESLYMSVSTAFCIQDRKTVSETVEGETIVINLETGTYYSFNLVASYIWNQIQKQSTVESIGSLISQNYGENAKQEALAFIETLVAEQLVLPVESSEVASAEGIPSVYATPMFTKYEDMQAMLLADPVHDVDQSGWPILKSDVQK